MPAAVRPPRIVELPEHVRNKIAAGEVVERPASVVKELVENALDAGAREVRVDLEEGGVRLVRVTDDGEGMGPADLALCFRPHATSKLRDVDDLEHVASLGFRGEALASIGSVARARVLSRAAGEERGFGVEDEGGRVGEPREAPAPPGTIVEVRDLFFNTPARRRFLKRPATELARCVDVVQRLALAHEGVGFVLTHDGRRVYDVEASMDLRARIRRTFGAELAGALAPVAARDGTTALDGFVAPPRFARRDSARQMWFLNGRPLRDRLLLRALREAYRGALEGARQPAAFLRLALDPAAVDVNVHPTKAEVRFREERRVMGFLVARLSEAVRCTDMATPGERLLLGLARRGEWAPPAASLPGPTSATDATSAGGPWPSADAGLAVREAPRAAALADASRAPALPLEIASLRGPGTVLRVARTYLVRALDDGLEIVDQHALHERLTYEALVAELARGAVAVQRLLVPELVEVSRDELALLEEHAALLARAGIELEPFGETTVAVQGVPARLRRPVAEELVRAALATLAEKGAPPGPAEVLEELLHRTACRSSVMAGDELDDAEVEALLARAEAAGHDQTCPHGRPTRVRFTRADLERAFHRR